MGFLSHLLGWVNSEPPKMMRPLQDHQWQPPIGPGGVTDTPRPSAPPPMSPDLELKLAGDPLSQLQWQQGDAPLDMSSGQIQRGVGAPQRGMEPLSAGMPQQLDLGADMRAAIMRAQAQPQSDPMLDWYRSEGQRDLNLQEGRDFYARSAQDYESRLGRTDRRRWW